MMLRSGNRSVAKLKAKSKKSRDSAATGRLADMSARMDSARSASYVRKPVFDRSLEVTAYELVVGDGPITSIEPAGDAGEQIRINSVLDIEPAEISDGNPIQLSVAAPVLEVGIPDSIGPADVMFILGSGFEPTPDATAAVEDLSARGFRFVLEDLAGNPPLGSLLRYAYAVRIDTTASTGPSLDKQIGVLKNARVVLMAEHIGSYDELRAATKQGFVEFQGSFLSRPDAFRKTKIPAGQLAALELVALLQNDEADIAQIADVIRRDVSLSYRILKVVNSAQYSLPRPLGSIEEAVMLVGTQQIVSWVGAMTMSGLNNKPTELTRMAMIRARVCESLAERLDRADSQRFYVAGLFSVIEALLDVPAEQALGGLPLADEILDAITSGGGMIGEVLRGVVAFEGGDWAHAHVIGLKDTAMDAEFRTATMEIDTMWSQIAG